MSNTLHTLGKKKYETRTKLTYKNLERYDEFQLTEEEKVELLRRRKMKQLARAIDSENNSPVDRGNSNANANGIDVNYELANADDPRFALVHDVD